MSNENEKRYYYAIINENDICNGHADAPGPIENEKYIPIESLPEPFGQKWTGEGWRELTEEEQAELAAAEEARLAAMPLTETEQLMAALEYRNAMDA